VATTILDTTSIARSWSNGAVCGWHDVVYEADLGQKSDARMKGANGGSNATKDVMWTQESAQPDESQLQCLKWRVPAETKMEEESDAGENLNGAQECLPT
jgi:hypothetical protein